MYTHTYGWVSVGVSENEILLPDAPVTDQPISQSETIILGKL